MSCDNVRIGKQASYLFLNKDLKEIRVLNSHDCNELKRGVN